MQSRICGIRTQRALSHSRVQSNGKMGHPYLSRFGAAHEELSPDVYRRGKTHSVASDVRRGGCRRYGQADRDDVRVAASRQRRRRPGMAMGLDAADFGSGTITQGLCNLETYSTSLLLYSRYFSV